MIQTFDSAVNLLFSLILTGLVIGLIYGLYAVGLALIYGVMRIPNFAHGEFYMLGGYALYYVTLLLGVNSWVGLPLAILIGAGAGYLFEFTCIRPIYKGKVADPGTYSTLVTFGLLIFLENFALLVFGPWTVAPPSFIPFRIQFGIGAMEGDRVAAGLISLGIIVTVYLFLKKTWVGKAFQATSQNVQGAQIQGINPATISALSFAIASGIAAATGALLGPIFMVYPNVGAVPVGKAFTINVVGGLGSISGCIVAGLIIGLVETLLSVYVNAAYKNLYGLIVLVVMVAIRPYGLFGKSEETRR